MTLDARSLPLVLTAVFTVAAACGPGVRTDDYLSAELRSAVEQLKADVATTATDATTIAQRATVLADWVDAYSLVGHEVGLEGPRVKLQATRPPGAGVLTP